MAVSFVMAAKGLDLMGDALSGALNTGVLEILDGAALLVTFSPLAAGTTVDGVITLTAPGMEVATGAGQADTANFYNNAKANLLATANVGIGVGFTVNLDNDMIAVDQEVTLSSCVITIPAGT
jgi:hypothetical protein